MRIPKVPKKKTKKPKRRVPLADHLARHCNSQRVIRDPITREIKGVWPEAFELRPLLNERYLSTHWMEHFSRQDIDMQFRDVVKALRAKRTVNAQSAIARLNVGSVVQVGAARGRSIAVWDRSSKNNPGYAAVYGLPLDNSDRHLLALLANQCCVQVLEVSGIDAAPTSRPTKPS
jgi:hypothetical protein